MLYKKKEFLGNLYHEIGVAKNGTFCSNTVATTSLAALSSAGNSEFTSFHIMYVSTPGIYTVRYFIGSYTSGTINEGIFEYKPDLCGIGNTIYNSVFVSPSAATIRAITNIKFPTPNFYYLCLRPSVGSAITFNSNTSFGSNTDLSFFTNRRELNTSAAAVQESFRGPLFLYDNSVNPASLLTTNGILSDFSPFQNLTPADNKFLRPNNNLTANPLYILLERTE